MKKIYLIALLGAAFGFTACEDKLDIPQKAVLTTETFYKTDNDAQQALASAYEQFQCNTMGRAMGPGIYTPARVLANHPGDDVCYGGEYYGDHEFGGSVNEFRFKHTPEAIDYHYKGLYLSIYNDNLVLQYFSKEMNPDAELTPYMLQAAAEARVLRACNYFLLACYWGTPPFVDHVLSSSDIVCNSDSELAPENAPKSQKDYFIWVAEECEKAVEDLTERTDPTDKEGTYRITKGFANAMAGKAYLFAGEFGKAETAFKKVIDSGKYELVSGDDFMDLFHIQGDGCPEKIFEVNVRYNAAAGEWSSGGGMGWNSHSTWMEPNCFQIRSDKFKVTPLAKYTGDVVGWGSIGIPEWFGNALYENDGDDSKRLKATMVRISDLVYGTTGIDAIDNSFTFSYRDKKTKETIFVPVEERPNWDMIGIKGGRKGHYGQSFWVPIKHVIRAGDAEEAGGTYSSGHRLNNIIIMRYAEVLLDYAECLVRNGKASEALKYINDIQQRAGSKTISSSVDLETVKKEKAFEMWFESCRYQDIMRYLRYGDNDTFTQESLARLKVQGKHIPHLCDKLSEMPADIPEAQTADADVVWENGDEASSRFFIFHTHEAQDAGFTVGWQDKHKLFPYPQTVLDNNPNLKQNEGW